MQLRLNPVVRSSRLTMPLLALLLAGCQMGGSQAALENELRMRAEENTQLKLIIHDLEVDLREAERKLERVEQADNGGGASRSTNGAKPQPPDVQLGPPGNDNDPAPAPRFNPQGRRPAAEEQSSRLRPHDLRVARVTLDPQRTSGWDADPETPGDEGLIVVVEPRNAAGELVPVAGQIAIAAYDAGLLEQHKGHPRRGELAHVGTWHFNPQDAQTWFLPDADGEKMHFELRWPEAAPASRQVRVYVRYVTESGRALQSNWSLAIQHEGTRDTNVVDAEPAPAQTPPVPSSAANSPPWHSALRNNTTLRNGATLPRPEWKPYR